MHSEFNERIVDGFTLYHIALWGLLAALLAIRTKASFLLTVGLGLALGLLWEVAETYIEVWLGFQEYFWNRWVSDPLADAYGSAMGWMLIRYFRKGPRS